MDGQPKEGGPENMYGGASMQCSYAHLPPPLYSINLLLLKSILFHIKSVSAMCWSEYQTYMWQDKNQAGSYWTRQGLL